MSIKQTGGRLAAAAGWATVLATALATSAAGAAQGPEHEGYAAAAANAATAIKNPATGWNHLWNEVIIDISVIGVIFALIMTWFLIRYRRRAGDGAVGRAPKLSPAAAVAWVVIPVFVFLS